MAGKPPSNRVIARKIAPRLTSNQRPRWMTDSRIVIIVHAFAWYAVRFLIAWKPEPKQTAIDRLRERNALATDYAFEYGHVELIESAILELADQIKAMGGRG